MLTTFGKFCRKLRIDYGQLLKDMADILGVTASYLSAVEIGKRAVPKKWKSIIIEHYSLDEEQSQILAEAIDLSKQDIKMAMNKFTESDKKLVLSFARSFTELNDDEKARIKNILNKKSQ